VIFAGSTFRREKMRSDPFTGRSITAQCRCSSQLKQQWRRYKTAVRVLRRQNMPRSPHDWGRALADQDAHVAIANLRCADQRQHLHPRASRATVRAVTLPAYTSGRLLVELLAHVLVTVGGIVTYAPVQLKRLV
jgi:hypothetical protein